MKNKEMNVEFFKMPDDSTAIKSMRLTGIPSDKLTEMAEFLSLVGVQHETGWSPNNGNLITIFLLKHQEAHWLDNVKAKLNGRNN